MLKENTTIPRALFVFSVKLQVYANLYCAYEYTYMSHAGGCPTKQSNLNNTNLIRTYGPAATYINDNNLLE